MANPEVPNPEVIVAGGGIAGLIAAHRLIERGYDVTLIECNEFLGGKLGAHQDGVSKLARETTCPACVAKGGCLRRGDWHEHCYHMYLNWYHNFWAVMEESGALGNFVPVAEVFNQERSEPGKPGGKPIPEINVGSPWTAARNLFNGTGSPLDMMLWSQTLADLVGQPARNDGWLEKTSLTSFMKDRLYTNDQAMQNTARTTAQAFALPSYLTSARTYKTFLSYGARLPEPMMWLVTGNAQAAIFTPWINRLAELAGAFTVVSHKYYEPSGPLRAAMEQNAASPGPGGRLTIHMLTSVERLQIDAAGRVHAIMIGRRRISPTIDRGVNELVRPMETLPVPGDVILAVPLSALCNLATPPVVQHAPNLGNVHYLRHEPMIAMDLYFRRKLPDLPKGITMLLHSPYEMSYFDNAQTWRELADGPTVLNVIASNADALVQWPDDSIVKEMLHELHHYISFSDDDIYHCRTHLQTNVGEELFVNQVGSWQWRPGAITGIPNLFIAGDYCRTFIDVVTIEGAAVSGLMAAEALRHRRRHGAPIIIREPDQYPVRAMGALAAAQRPFAYAASALSSVDQVVKKTYRGWFPNG